jgi:hypothetical protein
MDLRSLKKTISENLVYDLLKYAAIATGSIVIAAFTYVLHKWLPTHDLVAACIVLAIAICAFAWLTRQMAKGRATTTKGGLRVEARGEVVNPLPADASLRARAFEACNKLEAYIAKQGKRPDEGEIFNATQSLGSEAFAKRYQEEIAPWDNRIQAGYLLCFKDRLFRLRHEMVLVGFADEELDKALAESEQSPSEDYELRLRRVAEKIRILASRINT